jgi:6-phosphogluconolactonase
MKPIIRPYADRSAFEQALVAALESVISGAQSSGERALMLSGGSTPLPAYRAVAQRRPRAAPGLHILFSDDRYVPSDNPSSNYFQARALIDALGLDASRVLRVRTELPLKEAADDYAHALADLASRRVPIVLALLGIGADGHTCSLFTKQDLERARNADAIAVARPDGLDAVSATPRVLERAECVAFAVAGRDKQTATQALAALDRSQTAACAVAGCRHVEIWADGEALALVNS